MSVQEAAKFRKAIKIYDKTKAVSESDLKIILTIGALAPSSNVLEPVKVIIIKDQKLKEQAALNCFVPGNQQKLKDCPSFNITIRSKWWLFKIWRIFKQSLRTNF
ncbi:MAG: nitroreductase family protein [Spiroplasma phoeniceum]|nr:MAG: nitroreductase family protein [Spiroplasma phoeniceum]UZQ32491.1 MAG: nitroreductase family protein [Spiroplasma phoeniceum]